MAKTKPKKRRSGRANASHGTSPRTLIAPTVKSTVGRARLRKAVLDVQARTETG